MFIPLPPPPSVPTDGPRAKVLAQIEIEVQPPCFMFLFFPLVWRTAAVRAAALKPYLLCREHGTFGVLPVAQ